MNQCDLKFKHLQTWPLFRHVRIYQIYVSVSILQNVDDADCSMFKLAIWICSAVTTAIADTVGSRSV